MFFSVLIHTGAFLRFVSVSASPQTPIKFATPDTEVRYKDGSQQPFTITSLTTDVGTYPAGSQWRKNPVPMYVPRSLSFSSAVLSSSLLSSAI